jgi:hypothetical protein
MSEGVELDGHHRATVEKIFSHPVSHNIQWHDVLSLLKEVGTVTEEHDGRHKVTLGSETETFATTSMSNRSSTCAECSRAPAFRRSRHSESELLRSIR